MQFTILYALIALVPTLAMAGPVAPLDTPESAALFTKRGIDMCPSHTTKTVGQACSFTGGDGTPHACGSHNPAAIVSIIPSARHGS
jgi:hypothetical protein